MDRALIFSLLVLGVLVVALYYSTKTWAHNRLAGREEQAHEAQAAIWALLREKVDLIAGLLRGLTDVKEHELELIRELTGVRERFGQGMSAADEKQVEELAAKALALVEAYPELKYGESHKQYLAQLESMEHAITRARLTYNARAGTYNAALKRFPTNIVARESGKQPMEYHSQTEEA